MLTKMWTRKFVNYFQLSRAKVRFVCWELHSVFLIFVLFLVQLLLDVNERIQNDEILVEEIILQGHSIINEAIKEAIEEAAKSRQEFEQRIRYQHQQQHQFLTRVRSIVWDMLEKEKKLEKNRMIQSV